MDSTNRVTFIARVRQAGLVSDGSELTAARKLYLHDPPWISESYDDKFFRILDSVAKHFNVPFSSVRICGSASAGFSTVKGRDFKDGESDLDIAVIHEGEFCRWSEIVFKMTRGYTDLTKFPDTSTADSFQRYLARGYFRPDLMPTCEAKTHWFNFFRVLSEPHLSKFQSINGGLFQSELFFVGRQTQHVRWGHSQ